MGDQEWVSANLLYLTVTEICGVTLRYDPCDDARINILIE
jgi:hypothetical protein